MKSIIEFNDYKAFLKSIETERSRLQKGFRSRLAEVLGCQNAYITQVLNTHANLSLEQGLKIGRFLQLHAEELRYFLLLIEEARAGTAELRAYFTADLERMRLEHLDIRNRVRQTRALLAEDQNIYYSHWLYPTIHLLVTIPRYRKVPAIATALRLPESRVREIVLFLVTTELLHEKNGSLEPGPTQLHLPKDSPHIRQHHLNWRQRATQDVGEDQRSIHYSTVSSMSRADMEILKAAFVQLIQDYVARVGPSTEETLCNFNLDFYELIRPN